MKKLLIIAMCIATGMTFSQEKHENDHNEQIILPNNITVEGQIGMIDKTAGTPVGVVLFVNHFTPNLAAGEVDQVLMPEDFVKKGRNKVAVRQVGDQNKARGFQLGLGNMSLIRQNNTNFLPGQVGNLASTIQLGFENGADIKQFGDDNKGHIGQIGTGNYAVQNVGGDKRMAAEGNLAYAGQVGNNNRTSQKQRYNNNEATAWSYGDGNQIVQDQSSGPNQSSGSVAFVNQVGNENAAQQKQIGSNNYASAYQTGDGNTSLETQTMIGDSSEVMNLSTVNQVGNKNISSVTQYSNMGNNSSLVNQIGNGNSSLVRQATLEAKSASCVKQKGNSNTAQVTQLSGSGSGH